MIAKEFNGTLILDTFTLVVTNQGYWGRGSEKEDDDALATALSNANATGTTGKVKRGTIAWVSVIVVTEDDRIKQENLDADKFRIFPKDAKVGDVFKPCVGGSGNEIWLGSKVTTFTLKG